MDGSPAPTQLRSEHAQHLLVRCSLRLRPLHLDYATQLRGHDANDEVHRHGHDDNPAMLHGCSRHVREYDAPHRGGRDHLRDDRGCVHGPGHDDDDGHGCDRVHDRDDGGHGRGRGRDDDRARDRDHGDGGDVWQPQV